MRPLHTHPPIFLSLPLAIVQRPTAKGVSESLRLFESLSQANNLEFDAPVVGTSEGFESTEEQTRKRLQQFRNIFSDDSTWNLVEKDEGGIHYLTGSVDDPSGTTKVKIARAYIDVPAHAPDVCFSVMLACGRRGAP